MTNIVGLSERERDRLVVLRQVKEGKLTQAAAAEQLGLSARWVKKLTARLRREGDRGLAHRLRERALGPIRERYGDYGPTLASEMLAAEHGMAVNRETLRQWMSAEKLWKPKRQKLDKVHVWRPRRRRRGELVQWDTSGHDWLEGRGPKLYLIATIDDATSELTARFALSDSTAENMRLLGRYVERHGRPAAVYTDKAGLFQVNRPYRALGPPSRTGQPVGPQAARVEAAVAQPLGRRGRRAGLRGDAARRADGPAHARDSALGRVDATLRGRDLGAGRHGRGVEVERVAGDDRGFGQGAGGSVGAAFRRKRPVSR